MIINLRVEINNTHASRVGIINCIADPFLRAPKANERTSERTMRDGRNGGKGSGGDCDCGCGDCALHLSVGSRKIVA